MGSACAAGNGLIDRTIAKLPPFSPVLTRLLGLLANEENVSFIRVADLIEHDTVLSGNVLKLINSALYGVRGTVKSVRQAVALLGFSKVRNLALGLSVSRMWASPKTAPGWSMARFNMHSLAVALLADTLSQHLDVCEGEGAFIAGLLHDVGHLLIAVGCPNEHLEVMRLVEQESVLLPDAEQQVLGLDHAALSAEALEKWNLPLSLQVATRYHHRPEQDPTAVRPGVLRLSSVIQIAENSVEQISVGIERAPSANHSEEDTLAPLKLDEDSKAGILKTFDSEFQVMLSLF